MRVNSELLDAQLENKASDVTPSSTAKGLIYYKSTTEPIKVSDGTTVHKVLTDQMGPSIGTIVRANIPANYGISTSSGAFSTTSTSYVDITNLTVTITTTGRPVEIAGIQGYFNTFSGASSQAYAMIKCLRGAVDVAEQTLGVAQNESPVSTDVPGSVIRFVDVPAAGTYTYKLQIKKTIGTSADAQGVKILVREMF